MWREFMDIQILFVQWDSWTVAVELRAWGTLVYGNDFSTILSKREIHQPILLQFLRYTFVWSIDNISKCGSEVPCLLSRLACNSCLQTESGEFLFWNTHIWTQYRIRLQWIMVWLKLKGNFVSVGKCDSSFH